MQLILKNRDWFIFAFILLSGSGFLVHADTYTINDARAKKAIQQAFEWQSNFQQLNQLLRSANKVECLSNDMQCAEKRLNKSDELYRSFKRIVTKWRSVNGSSKKMVELFKQAELPNAAQITRQQFASYLFLLNQISDENDSFESAILASYLKGRLGLYRNYEVYFEMQAMLANEAQKVSVNLSLLRIYLSKLIQLEQQQLVKLII